MSGQHRFDTLRARMTPQRRAQNAATTQAVLADIPPTATRDQARGAPDMGEDVQAPEPERGESAMGKIVELSEETYHQLADLAQHQQRTVEEMLRLCLAAYEEALYQRAHAQMVADGILVSLPAPPLLPGETEEDDDFEPVEIPGKPLSEIILEDRR